MHSLKPRILKTTR